MEGSILKSFLLSFKARIVTSLPVRALSISTLRSSKEDSQSELWEDVVQDGRKMLNRTDTSEPDVNPLSQEQAVTFYEKILKISDPLQKFKKDPMALLHLTARKSVQAVPWQTITFYQVKPEDRKYLPFEQVCDDLMRGKGGVCHQTGLYYKYLLQKIGYHTHLYWGTSHGLVGANLGAAVEDLMYPGSTHLLEVGRMFPIDVAIPLDFEKESPVYEHHFLKYKWVRRSDGAINFLHEARRDTITRKITEEELGEGWYIQAVMDVHNAIDIKKLIPYFNHFISPAKGLLRYMYGVRARTYLPDGRMVLITENQLITSDGKRNLYFTPIKSTEELKCLFLEYFPQFSQDEIETALANSEYELHTYFKQKLKK